MSIRLVVEMNQEQERYLLGNISRCMSNYAFIYLTIATLTVENK